VIGLRRHRFLNRRSAEVAGTPDIPAALLEVRGKGADQVSIAESEWWRKRASGKLDYFKKMGCAYGRRCEEKRTSVNTILDDGSVN
jgi:hypothetical protein